MRYTANKGYLFLNILSVVFANNIKFCKQLIHIIDYFNNNSCLHKVLTFGHRVAAWVVCFINCYCAIP